MDVIDQDGARERILEKECAQFWESAGLLLKEIASKAESPARHIGMINDSVDGCVIIQTQEGRCPDAFHGKIRTLTVRFNSSARTITAEAINSCPGVPEQRPERFIFEADLENGTAFALLGEARFTEPVELANYILAKFFRLRPLKPAV